MKAEDSKRPAVRGVASKMMWAAGKDERKRRSAGVVITASPIQFVPRTRLQLIGVWLAPIEKNDCY